MKCYSVENNFMNRDDIDVRYIEYGCDEPEHMHDGIEITYVAFGQGEHIIDGNTIHAKRGTFLIIDYNCVHSIHMWENMKYYNILIKASFLSYLMDKDAPLQKIMQQYYDYETESHFLYTEFEDIEMAQRIENLFYSLLREEIGQQSRNVGFMRCYLDEVMNLFLRNLIEKPRNEVDETFANAVRYITSHSDEMLSLESVAKVFNYNQRYFSNKLKKYCGLSFKQLLLRKRLSDVIYYLWKSEDSINDIVLKCGFTNRTFFYEIFEKTYGIKPKFIREYRNNYNRYIEFKTKYSKLLY